MNGFFEIVTNLVNELGVAELPNRFYDLDDVGLALDPKARKCFYHKGVKNAQFLVPTEGKAMFTVLFCGNASDQYLPPYIVYKERGNHIIDSWMVGGPDQCAYNQRWSPRGRPWPRGHILKSLVLASKPQVLGLGLEALGPRKFPCPRLEYSTIF